MKILKWLTDKIRNTFLILLVSLLVSLVLLILGIGIILFIIICFPAVIVAILIWAVYLIISGWFRITIPEWQKSLINALEKFNKEL